MVLLLRWPINENLINPTISKVALLQVFAIEFVAFAIEFVPFAIVFVGFAIEFVLFVIEFVGFVIEFLQLN